ncbi:hypothetical protein ACFPIJ_50710 [Dactylosporangium cerinum]|uniref:Uncharacterized protein n=1 Tax=Dactylosporangium cerinum TaxID=1434730 RepID=A0ABV9WCJ6_9ACTN
MTTKRSFRALLHRAIHRLPGVPAHTEQPGGHQGTSVHSHAGAPQPGHGRNHSPARPPRFMPAWQRRVAGFFGREV